jgi:hypothetical protein
MLIKDIKELLDAEFLAGYEYAEREVCCVWM